MKEGIDQEPPFAGDLDSIGGGWGKVFKFVPKNETDKLSKDPEKVVRMINKNHTVHVGRADGWEDILKKHKIGKELFAELSNKYNFSVLVPEIVVGPSVGDSNEQAVYSVVDRIHGKSLEHFNRNDFLSAQEDITRLFFSVMDYFYDKIINGGRFLHDALYISQCMYGKKKENKKNKIYIVDVDPLFSSTAYEGDEGWRERTLSLRIDRLVDDIKVLSTLGLDVQSLCKKYIDTFGDIYFGDTRATSALKGGIKKAEGILKER